MRLFLLASAVTQLILVASAKHITGRCVEEKPRIPKTCFLDPWPELVICPNHFWHGPHDHITKAEMEEAIADPGNLPSYSSDPLRTEYTLQQKKSFHGKVYDFTKIWTFETVNKFGVPMHTFGGVYWLLVSTCTPITRLSLKRNRIPPTPRVRRCGV